MAFEACDISQHMFVTYLRKDQAFSRETSVRGKLTWVEGWPILPILFFETMRFVLGVLIDFSKERVGAVHQSSIGELKLRCSKTEEKVGASVEESFAPPSH